MESNENASLEAPFPAEWTVLRALDAYLDENAFTRESYSAPWVKIVFPLISFPLPNPPSRQSAVRFHDLHHVVTGYGTDPCGEAEISAWELRNGLGRISLFVKWIILSGMLLGFVHSPRRTWRAWKTAPKGRNLFRLRIEDDYERLLVMSVGELRRELGLPEAGIAGPRRLHAAAPAR